MSKSERPPYIRHYLDIQGGDDDHYPGSEERLGVGSRFSPPLGLKRLGIHHEYLAPGRRTSFPHAESAEEEFVYVIEGHPDVWIDGELFALSPGDGVGFPAGTGIAHSFLNNTDQAVRLLVVGEADKPENRIVYPVNPELRPYRKDWWENAPARPLGPHDGRPRKMGKG